MLKSAIAAVAMAAATVVPVTAASASVPHNSVVVKPCHRPNREDAYGTREDALRAYQRALSRMMAGNSHVHAVILKHNGHRMAIALAKCPK